MSNIEFESLDNIPEDSGSEAEPETAFVPWPNGIERFRLETSNGRRITRAAYENERMRLEPGMSIQFAFWDIYGVGNVRRNYSALLEWAEENNLVFSAVSTDTFSVDGVVLSIPYWFCIGSEDDPESKRMSHYFSSHTCSSCGNINEFPSSICGHCGESFYCRGCRTQCESQTHDQSMGPFCENCGGHCEQCDEIFHSAYPDCPTCNPMENCFNCGINFPEGTGNNFTARTGRSYIACNQCWEYTCSECAGIVSDGLVESHTCSHCVAISHNEEWDESSELETDELAIPTIPGRETIRLVGVEIEGANGDNVSGRDGGNLLATRLYDEGLSSSYGMEQYHHGSGNSLVHVERDSSVDWEMVIGPLNVADSEHVDVLNRSVRLVRRMINEDRTLKLDMRAGLHVHVGAANVGFNSAYNLHILYMHNEDFLYRIGAAKWPHHRSIIRRGRDTAGKSPQTQGKLNFARTFRENRYYGLSFENYFARYFGGCHCGARQYGLFEECTCELGKCTFEFRLFNTTANTIKIHAYLALCQALVAKAIELPEITDVSEYPALDFEKYRLSDMSTSMKRRLSREWEKRIEFVNNELPLTEEEKKSIHYCVINSEIGKVVNNADILISGGNA